MKIFGRPLGRYFASLARAPQYLREAVICARIFESPAAVLKAYVTRRRPQSGLLTLKTGMKIFLSHDDLDVVTVFGLFVRGDYGEIRAGSRVVDIGANIGVFSLYSVYCGASVVHAYEPSAESFECLQRNVEQNALGDRVKIFRVAVGSPPERTVRFPRKSSVLNAMLAADEVAEDGYDEVPLETLGTVLARMPEVDLIKLDCEGEEEAILAGCDAETLARAAEVRLEYHNYRGDAVLGLMKDKAFKLVHHWAPDRKGGLAWFVRSAPPR